MTSHRCDACRANLADSDDQHHYAVRVEVQRVNRPVELADADLDDQDDPAHLAEVAALLCSTDRAACLRHTVLEPSQTSYVLCTACYAKFQADPLGVRRRRNGNRCWN